MTKLPLPPSTQLHPKVYKDVLLQLFGEDICQFFNGISGEDSYNVLPQKLPEALVLDGNVLPPICKLVAIGDRIHILLSSKTLQ